MPTRQLTTDNNISLNVQFCFNVGGHSFYGRKE